MRESLRGAAAGAALAILAWAPAAMGQEKPTLKSCKANLGLTQADAGVMKLLSTPAMPPPGMVFAAQDARRIMEWDFPPKVTAWKERPTAAELALEWEEVNRIWHGAKPGDTSKAVPPADYRPYQLLSVAPRDWQELEKWMVKETGKQSPGACYDEGNATYLFVAAEVRDPTAGATNQGRTLQYSQSAGQPQSEGAGPGQHSATTTAHNAVADQFAAGDSANDPSIYACVYLYRREGTSREAVPEYYYCHAASSLKSSIQTMFKFATKQGLI